MHRSLVLAERSQRYLDLRQDGYRFGLKPLPLAAIYVLEERLDGRTMD